MPRDRQRRALAAKEQCESRSVGDGEQDDEQEAVEEALADEQPGGSLNPTG